MTADKSFTNGGKLELLQGFTEFAKMVGSFLCFQWDEATFRVGGRYFPVCAGCFGIYLGSLIALSFFPSLPKWSRRICSVKYGVAMVLPMVVYWAVLNIELLSGTRVVPGIKEVYALTGVLLGIAVGNAAYYLCLETPYVALFSEIARRLWALPILLVLVSVPVFFLYSVEDAVIFAASLVFLLGLLDLAFFTAAWAVASIASYAKGAG